VLIVEVLSTGGIVGIIVGCAVVAVLWGAWTIWHKSRKNRKRTDEMALEGKPT
jgi:predicted PurR-regulated permease PerM